MSKKCELILLDMAGHQVPFWVCYVEGQVYNKKFSFLFYEFLENGKEISFCAQGS